MKSKQHSDFYMKEAGIRKRPAIYMADHIEGGATMSLEFNSTMAEKYELIVIGTGAAGLTAANFAAWIDAGCSLSYSCGCVY